MELYGVISLKQNRLIVSKRDWIENAVIGVETRVFFSPDDNEQPNFTTESKYFFDGNKSQCYEGLVIKFYESRDDAQRFAEWKRPKKNRFSIPKLVDEISLVVSEQSV